MYELKLEKFSGPLDKLLELIEGRELDITEISLAQVTDDFLRHVKSLTEASLSLRTIADFISIASKLILIKSKNLIPSLPLTEEEEADIKDLERRLKLYQELKPMLKNISNIWNGKKSSFGRAYFLEAGAASGVFYPGSLEIQKLVFELEKLFESIKKQELDTDTIKEKIISIEEKIEEIMRRLQSENGTSFSGLSGTKTRSEAIAIFLAILHLAREQLVLLEQKEHFSDIIITKQESRK